MRQILLYLLILLFFSCTKDKKHFYLIKNNDSKLIKTTTINTLSGENIGPIDKYGLIKDIQYNNNELLMLERKSDSVFIKYNLLNKSIKKSITRGEAPNQIRSPQFAKITGFYNFSDSIQIYDFNKGLFNINFDKQKITPIFKLDKTDYRSTVQSIVMIKNNLYAFANLDIEKFYILDDINKEIKKIPENKELDMVYSNKNLRLITPTDIGFNKKNRVLFTWNGILNSIDIFDETGKYLKSYKYGVNQNIENKNIKRKYFYYNNLKSFNNFIYGIYSGFNVTENFTQSLIPHLKSEIHIFNIKTNEVKRIKLDRLINCCTIDFKHNIIYAIEENNESQPLVKYEMDKKN